MNLFKVILLSIITSLPIYGQRQYQKQVYTHAIDNIDEFIEFLSYPNDANFKSDINELINWTEDKFQSLDFKIQKLDTETFPLLLASKHLNDDFKTILIYLHLDGQPIDTSKWNQKDPFTPVYKIKENGNFTKAIKDQKDNINFFYLARPGHKFKGRSRSVGKYKNYEQLNHIIQTVVFKKGWESVRLVSQALYRLKEFYKPDELIVIGFSGG